MENIPQKILDQVKKLLTFANDSRGDKNELEVAAAKASALMLKYNLEMHQLQPDTKPGIEGVQVKINDRQSKHDGKFVLGMYNTISRYNFCSIIHLVNPFDLGAIGIVGTPENIQAVGYISDQLLERVKEMEKRVWKQEAPHTSEKRNAFRRGYYMGAIAGIGRKLFLERELQTQEQEKAEAENNRVHGYSGSQQGTALTRMEVNNQGAIQDFMKQAYPNAEPGRKTTPLKAERAKALGYADGKNMSIRQGLGGSKTAGYVG